MALLVVLGLSLVGCAGDREQAVVLDGSARYPDDQGIATTARRDQITLDDERTYKVSEGLAAFSTATATLEPMSGREGQYVQVGLDGDTVIWMAGVAAVVNMPQGPRVFYAGTLRRVDSKGRLIFKDGTVWELAPGLDPPPAGQYLQLEIDPVRHKVVKAQGA